MASRLSLIALKASCFATISNARAASDSVIHPLDSSAEISLLGGRRRDVSNRPLEARDKVHLANLFYHSLHLVGIVRRQQPARGECLHAALNLLQISLATCTVHLLFLDFSQLFHHSDGHRVFRQRRQAHCHAVRDRLSLMAGLVSDSFHRHILSGTDHGRTHQAKSCRWFCYA